MNIKRKSTIAIIVAIAFGQVTVADTDAVVADNTAFAFELYPQLQAEGNLFFSPYSISSALAMTYAGARGNTAAQMSQVLHFAPDQTQFHPAFGDLQASVNATQAKGDIALNVAITTYRGPEESWIYVKSKNNKKAYIWRLIRLMDAYLNLSGYNTYNYEQIDMEIPLNIPASRFLRAYSVPLSVFEPLKLRRAYQTKNP
ncbi:MAG: serpin family protein [Pseudomonadota bacterium]